MSRLQAYLNEECKEMRLQIHLNEKYKIDKCPKCGWKGSCWEECDLMKNKSKEQWVFVCPKCGSTIKKFKGYNN